MRVEDCEVRSHRRTADSQPLQVRSCDVCQARGGGVEKRFNNADIRRMDWKGKGGLTMQAFTIKEFKKYKQAGMKSVRCMDDALEELYNIKLW